jgi:predicted nucleic acid-binding protein
VEPVVVDASAVVDYLLSTDRAVGIAGLIESPKNELIIPVHCDLEVASSLRRLLLQRRISLERTAEALDDYVDLPLQRHGLESLLGRIISLRKYFSAYDAAYVALAELVGAPLLTTDRSLARAVEAHTDLPLLISD